MHAEYWIFVAESISSAIMHHGSRRHPSRVRDPARSACVCVCGVGRRRRAGAARASESSTDASASCDSLSVISDFNLGTACVVGTLRHFGS
eukprot:COSAG02_NODE_1371_length_13018_cov_6.783265_3_plen_91_part_00